MSFQRYERVSHNDDETFRPIAHSRSKSPEREQQHGIPSSPPPSFRSQASSPHRRSISDRDPLVSDADRNLADTFDAPSESDSDDAGDNDNDDSRSHRRLDERQRVMSGRPPAPVPEASVVTDDSPPVERQVTRLPVFSDPNSTIRVGRGSRGHDGVFANLSAKPERGEDLEEKPPTYEQAAADATPPYWENTIFAPGGSAGDEVYIDGLPVGSLFSFVWNGMISMSFQLVGFLLTYLLHSTHAAKNGSKAGLGITLIQYGFSLKGASTAPDGEGGHAGDGSDGSNVITPSDPNNHNFDPNNPIAVLGPSSFTSTANGSNSDGSTSFGAMGASDWFAYSLMIVGWFVLIRAISEYLKARRHESLVLQSPSRGLDVAVVAEGEEPARIV